MVLVLWFLFFFFSSRRRHTRSYGDWSSDVCSSDLHHAEAVTLGKRIGVMRAGPRSQVKGVVEVSLNGARSRTDDAFLRYYKVVHEMIQIGRASCRERV